MVFQRARRTRTVMLMVPVCPESGSLDVPHGPRPTRLRKYGAGGADVTGLPSAPSRCLPGDIRLTGNARFRALAPTSTPYDPARVELV